VIHLVTGDAQIGLGVVRDPVSGDFLFTTSNNDIYLLSDTIPEPSTISLAICGAALIAVLRRRGLKGRPTVN
jgi:hypothetical protein